MKKNTFTLASLATLAFAAILVAGCSGDDGAPGPAGTNGTNGTNGTAGTNGTNGTNGAGFDEAIAKGNIILYLDGTRPDGVAFKDTIDYRFASTDPDDSRFYDDTDEGEESDIETYVMRYKGYDATGGGLGIYSYGWYYNDTDPKSQEVEVYLNNTVIEFPEEHKYFDLNMDYVYLDKYFNTESETVETETNLSEPDFASFTFDVATTGKVAYKFSGIVAGGSNSTGSDLKITVVANASVVQSIEAISEGGDRHQKSENGRTASVKIAKAVMQSMK